MTKDQMNYFNELNNIDVSSKIEKKNGLSYLSWAWAWAELKKRHPDAFYTVYENSNGWFYHTDGLTAWVKTGVTVNGLEHIEYLPVMDFKNRSIPIANITSFDVNKAIQRSLTKAVARHGLGLYIYAGEDLPEEAVKDEAKAEPVKTQAKAPAKAQTAQAKPTATAKAHNPIRAELVELCKANPDKLNLTELAKEYKLNNDAPDENFKKALDYARFCLRLDELDVNTDVITEV